MVTTRHLNWWLAAVLDAFYAAREQWLADLESVTALYPGDVALYRQEHPMPQLRAFLITSRLY